MVVKSIELLNAVKQLHEIQSKFNLDRMTPKAIMNLTKYRLEQYNILIDPLNLPYGCVSIVSEKWDCHNSTSGGCLFFKCECNSAGTVCARYDNEFMILIESGEIEKIFKILAGVNEKH